MTDVAVLRSDRILDGMIDSLALGVRVANLLHGPPERALAQPGPDAGATPAPDVLQMALPMEFSFWPT